MWRDLDSSETFSNILLSMPKCKREGDLASGESKRRKVKEQWRNETNEEWEARLPLTRGSKNRWKENLTDKQQQEIRKAERVRLSAKRHLEKLLKKENQEMNKKRITMCKVHES